MATKIIDTNVLLSASQESSQHQVCQRICVQFLRQLLKGNLRFVTDEQGLFYREYRKQLYPDPQPFASLSSQFLSYFITNQYNSLLCSRVSLIENNDEFVDFPTDPALATFDRSDRKWVAAAKALRSQNQEIAQIVNAMDSDWLHFEAALNQHGIEIDFLCGKEHLKK